jgi:hypothetical protein
LYLFFDLSALNQLGVARAIGDAEIQVALGIDTVVREYFQQRSEIRETARETGVCDSPAVLSSYMFGRQYSSCSESF